MDGPRLTIGMATFDDYDGCWATLIALRAHNALSPEDELLVVDNNPASAHGMQLRDLCQSGKLNVKYVPFGDAVGTSAPRDRVFAEASGEAVMCVDCHIMLATRHGPRLLDPIRAFRDFYANANHAKDMLCGVILCDNGTPLGTQFNAVWRAEMWGVWGSAWVCPCGGEDPGESLEFTPVQVDETDGLVYRHTVSQEPVSGCSRCGRALPKIGWPGHQQALLLAGYYWHGLTPDGDPFEVPGQGLGLFAMRRDAWVGFNPHARGFGGEELYVHAKVRNAGGRVLCHPSIRWYHRFGRPGGVPYRAERYAKVRNYVLEFLELGRDLDPIHEHWVTTKLLSAAEWDYLVEDPVSHIRPKGHAHQEAQQHIDNPRRRFEDPNQPPDTAHNLDTLYDWTASRKRDLDQHAPKIRELASQAKHITAIVKRREWDAFLLAGRPDDLVTYTTERDPLHAVLMRTVERTETNPRAPRRLKHYTIHSSRMLEGIHEIEETDLLAIDTIHHADQLTAELAAYAPRVRERIAIRGTQAFGEKAEDGNGPGLLVALRAFMLANPEWSVIYHSPAQYGLTVISRKPEDKKPMPSIVTLAANFAKAVAEHVADGLAKVAPVQLTARLEVCTLCEQRNGERCAVCGCFQQPKAAMRSSECPLGRWPSLETTEAKTYEVPG